MNSTNNPPVATPDTASVTEDETLVATGNVLANDTDPNTGLTLSVTAVDGIAVYGTTTIVGSYGTLVIQPNGQYTYTLADSQANVRALGDGQVATDAFSYTVSDGQTYTQTTTQTVENLIPQSEAFDDQTWVKFSFGTLPVVTANVNPGPNGGASTADQVTLTSADCGLYYQTNAAGTYTFSVWVRLVSGDGDFALNYYSGSTGLDLTQAVLATSAWQQVSLTFTGDGNTLSNVALMHDLAQSASGTFELWGAQLNPGRHDNHPACHRFRADRRCHRQHAGGGAGHRLGDRRRHIGCDRQRARRRYRWSGQGTQRGDCQWHRP
jgi:trimeric autotransporter adhesin